MQPRRSPYDQQRSQQVHHRTLPGRSALVEHAERVAGDFRERSAQFEAPVEHGEVVVRTGIRAERTITAPGGRHAVVPVAPPIGQVCWNWCTLKCADEPGNADPPRTSDEPGRSGDIDEAVRRDAYRVDRNGEVIPLVPARPGEAAALVVRVGDLCRPDARVEVGRRGLTARASGGEQDGAEGAYEA